MKNMVNIRCLKVFLRGNYHDNGNIRLFPYLKYGLKYGTPKVRMKSFGIDECDIYTYQVSANDFNCLNIKL